MARPTRAATKTLTISRPWLKKKPSLAPSLSLNETESSEEEVDRVCRSIQGVLKSHDVRMSAMERLEADKELFTSGKVNAMKAKFNLLGSKVIGMATKAMRAPARAERAHAQPTKTAKRRLGRNTRPRRRDFHTQVEN